VRLVVDASVAVKWVIRAPDVEADSDRALELLDAAQNGIVDVVQPPHWLAEVAAVLSRVRPEGSGEAIDLLDALDLAVEVDADIYKRASRIATQIRQHLFDTLYHAVALERSAILVTADERYLRKARALGNVISLADWSPPATLADE
jgi:predicted nucleic acid-binding protein